MASNPNPTTTRWQKLRFGRLKCNIDVAINPALNRIGIGIRVRDDDGAYVLAKTLCFTPMTFVHLG